MIDLEMEVRAMTCTNAALKALRVPLNSAEAKEALTTLEEEQRWFSQTRHTIHGLGDLGTGSKDELLRDAMLERLEGQLESIAELLRELSAPSIPMSLHGPVPVFDTSESSQYDPSI